MSDQISIEISPLILKLHKKVRGALEDYLGSEWRIIKLEHQSMSSTRKTEH